MEKDWTEKDLEDSLRRAFGNDPDDSLVFDGHTTRNPFLLAGLQFGIDKGWIEFQRRVQEEQWTTDLYGFTSEGKAYFGQTE